MTEKPPYDIEITRVLDAPRERVYEAFTDPATFAEWYGPVGFPVRRDSVELGGVAHARTADHLPHTPHHSGEVEARLDGLEAQPVGGTHIVDALCGGDQALRG